MSKTNQQTFSPSAKAHERVTGRWQREVYISNSRDRIVHIMKQISGSTIPALFTVWACLVVFAPVYHELALGLLAVLLLTYIATDFFASSRELQLWRIGPDFALLGLMIAVAITTLSLDGQDLQLKTLASAAWIPASYLLCYAWQLFPGLDRRLFSFYTMVFISLVFGIIQHFTGLDFFGMKLTFAPIAGQAFYIIQGAQFSGLAFGTVMAMLMCVVATMAVWPSRGHIKNLARGLAIAFTVTFLISLFWTYSFGIWVATIAGLVSATFMVGRRIFLSLALVIAAIALASGLSLYSPNEIYRQVNSHENDSAAQAREHLNRMTASWKEAPFVGQGLKDIDINLSEPKTPSTATSAQASSASAKLGNVYFLVLQRFGLLGALAYMALVLSFLLSTYQLYKDIPTTHDRHRMIVGGLFGAQISFHVAGLFWHTIDDGSVMAIFAFLLGTYGYIWAQYGKGVVSDDRAL
jgi:hypothetical protein